MSNSIAEGKLAKFIQYIASTEADIENNRLRLANNPNFDPFQNFRDLDRSEKGYLNERDLSDLLKSFKANVDERDLEPLLTTYKDGIRKVTFQDFLRHISPKSDPSLKNVFLTRFGVRSGSKTNLDETQRAIANIYKKEADYFREIENLRHSLTNEPKYEEAVYSLADATTGSLSSQSIAKFMSKHHYNFNTSDFDSLIRRLDTNKRGQLTLHELNSFIYPGEFQSNSNYSISHGGNYRYDVQGSLFDSMSTPGRDVNYNPQNIRVNETYIPPSTSFGTYHGLKYSPPKANPEVIAERIITGTDYRPSAHYATLLEERKPAIEIKRVNIDPIPQPSSVHHVLTRSPAVTTVHESHYNSKIAAIRDHPLYQMPPPPTHVVTHVEQVRREIPVPERIVANIPAPTRLISQLPLPSHTVTTVENVRREVPERLVSTHVTPSRHLTKEYLRPSYASTNSYTLSATRPSVDTKSALAGGALKGSTRPYTLLRDNIDLRKSNAYTKTGDEKVVSVSPIKRTTNIDTNIGKNYQYITANIPPKYQLSSLQHTGNATATFEKTAVTRENIEQRNSAKTETKPAEENATAPAPTTTTTTTQARPETNVTSSVSRNYSYITPNIPPKYQVSGTSSLETRQPYSRDNQTSSYSRVAPLSSQKPGYSYVDRNAKATELLAQRDTGLRTGSAAPRSDLHYTEKQETYSKTTAAQETAGEAGKPEEIRHSTVLETYKTDNAQRAGSIQRPSYVEERAGYGISARPVHDAAVKTEGDQVTAASSYKFANSKYEQLWGPEPDNE